MQVQGNQVQDTVRFRAIAGSSQGLGATPGEALNNLMQISSNTLSTPIVIWPYNRGDAYFTEGQQQRLNDLKARRADLTTAEQEEWEQLVEASFDATVARTQAVQSSRL